VEPRERIWPYWLAIALLALALALYLLLDKWGLSLWGDHVDYDHFGNWSDAVSGIATAIAVIVALLSIHIGRTADRAAVRAKDLDAETAVYIWLQHKKIEQASMPAFAVWDVIIRNTTPAPIYQWKVTIHRGPIFLCNHDLWPLRPGHNLFNVRGLDGVDPSQTPEVSISFEGRSGKLWTRTTKGRIQPAEQQALDCEHPTRV